MYALREEGDMGLFVPIFDDVRFLSTPSARRATCQNVNSRGRRRISIHALREEGDRQNPQAGLRR